MKKLAYFSILIFFISGCATSQVTPEESVEPIKKEIAEPIIEQPQVKEDTSSVSDLENIEQEIIEEYVQKNGIIFGKTDFQGVLETTYVKLFLENKEDPEKKYQLLIAGEETDPNIFAWEVKTVKPGYFYVELPAGEYKISTIAIPVGTTTADEPMDVNFEVIPDKIVYIGTLKVIGTKEKIKLGGVPVIKPGFEYTLEVIDEGADGIANFHNNYPNISKDIEVKLMQVGVTEPNE